MRDIDTGKRMVEEMVLDQILDSFPRITGRKLTPDWSGDFPRHEGSPDFVVGVDGRALGIELARIAGDTAWTWYEEASRIAWKKHDSYQRRDLFRNPIALIFHSDGTPLYDMEHELESLVDAQEFQSLGFAEVWAVDLSDAYYTPGHPLRRADLFCLKPLESFGFHRIGDHGRKPYG